RRGFGVRWRVPRRAVAAVALCAMAATGCSHGADSAMDSVVPSASAAPAYGDTFIDSLLGNISSLIPTITSDNASPELGSHTSSGLVTFDKDLKPVGDLAESWEFSKDCRDLTFRLRPGVKWHDGQPFTADDVVFTWQTIIDPGCRARTSPSTAWWRASAPTAPTSSACTTANRSPRR